MTGRPAESQGKPGGKGRKGAGLIFTLTQQTDGRSEARQYKHKTHPSYEIL